MMGTEFHQFVESNCIRCVDTELDDKKIFNSVKDFKDMKENIIISNKTT